MNPMQITEKEGVHVLETLQIMENLVTNYSKDIVTFVNNVLKFDISGISLKEFFEIVKTRRYYDFEDIIGEIIQRPAITLLNGGDCDDKAILIASFIKEFMPNTIQYFKAIKYKNNYEHVYNTIQINNKKIPIDATYPDHRFAYEKQPYDSAIYWQIRK